jgi:hypothetical protein
MTNVVGWVLLSILHRDFIHKTPTHLFLAGFKRLHDRVAGFVEMLGGVFPGGIIATAYMPARQTDPQAHPPPAVLLTCFTTF